MSEATANQRPHGHVTPNADGYLARCGGPKICKVCMQELAALKQPISTDPLILSSPARIYLIVGDECPRDAKFSELAEVTWCEDDLDGGIEYVRADLKARARLGNAVVMPERADIGVKYHWLLIETLDEAFVFNEALDEVARLNPSRGVSAESLLRRILDSDVGRQVLDRLATGQATETEDGKAWLEASDYLSAAQTPAPTVEPAHSDVVKVPLELPETWEAKLMRVNPSVQEGKWPKRWIEEAKDRELFELRALLNGGRS